MAIEIGQTSAMFVIALLTYLTRIGGLLIMSWITMSPRAEKSLEALAGSVLVAIVVPAAFAGDLAAKAAVIAAILVMMKYRSPVLGMSAGLVAAIAIRAAGDVF